jgi:SecD/SecF fusion protein
VFGKDLVLLNIQDQSVKVLEEHDNAKTYEVHFVFDRAIAPSVVEGPLAKWFSERGVNPKDAGLKNPVGVGAAEIDPNTQRSLFKEVKVTFKLANDLPVATTDPSVAAQDGTGKPLANYIHDELHAQPLSDRLENFDSQFAKEVQGKAFYAIALSWLAICLYLWFRFGNWTFGLAAVLCLVHDLLFALGVIGACHWLAGTFIGDALMIQDFRLDLTGVAALLTLVGYSVSDTIVVFDRIREVRGKSPELTPQMINDSVNQTLSRTLLTSFTTFLVVIVLYIWGGEGVHLFSFIMVVGIVIGTFSSIYVASPLLLMLGEGRRAERVGGRVEALEAGV